MIWTVLSRWAGLVDAFTDRFALAWVRALLRVTALWALWWGLVNQSWIPPLISGVLAVPLFGGMLVAGGPVAAYQAIHDVEGDRHGVARIRYTEVMERIGLGLMGISGAFAVGTMIGLTIIQNGSANACGYGALCFIVMWWAISAGVWTVVAGIWGMTRVGDSHWSELARELAGRLVVGTTVVAAVLLVVFAFMFSGGI